MIESKLMDNFASAIRKLSEKIIEENPDLIIYSLRGAVPIADFLRIVNPTIATFQSEYMPASSSISETDFLIKEWIKNALIEYVVRGENLKVVSIDEIMSGHSVSRVLRGMKHGRSEFRIETAIEQHESDIDFKSLGLLDLRHKKSGKEYLKPYLKLLKESMVFPIEVDQNIVMDHPKFNPLILEKNEDDPLHYLPTFKSYEMTPEYLDLLKAFSLSLGQELSIVCLQNPEAIRKSERFLPDKYRRK